MTRYIPIQCAEIDGERGTLTKIQFIIPKMGTEFTGMFVASRARAAMKRATKIADMAVEGKPEKEIIAALEKFSAPAKFADRRLVPFLELDKFEKDNGWHEVVRYESAEAPAPAPGELVTTSDGRYVVNTALGTVRPVEDMPRSIAAVMPEIWTSVDGVGMTPIFDIPDGMEDIAEYENEAADRIIPEIAEILGIALPVPA